MMRILADENCDRLLVTRLRDAGHDVIDAAEMASGEDDAQLLRRAQLERRVILTDDRDFGLLAERETGSAPAILLLRRARLVDLRAPPASQRRWPRWAKASATNGWSSNPVRLGEPYRR